MDMIGSAIVKFAVRQETDGLWYVEYFHFASKQWKKMIRTGYATKTQAEAEKRYMLDEQAGEYMYC